MERERLEELLSSYLDGELDEREHAVAERLLAQDVQARRLLEELRLTAGLVSTLPRHQAPESIVLDVQSQIERQALLGESPAATSAVHGRRTLLVFLSLAAMLAIMIPMGWYLAAQSSKKLALNRLTMNEDSVKETLRSGASSAAIDAAAFRKDDEHALALSNESLKAGRASQRKAADGEGRSIAAQSAASSQASSSDVETFEKKLALGVAPAALRRHPYETEPVQLQVIVRDEQHRDTLVSQITSHLTRNRFTNLSEEAVRNRRTLPADTALFDTGTPGVNYAGTTRRQMIVRGQGHTLQEVFQEIESIEPGTTAVELSVAGARVRGVEPVKQNLQALGQAPPLSTDSLDPPRGESTIEELLFGVPGEASQVEEDASSAMVSGLLQVVGLDQETSRRLGRKFAESVEIPSPPSDIAPRDEELAETAPRTPGIQEGGLVDRAIRRAKASRNDTAETVPQYERSDATKHDSGVPSDKAQPSSVAQDGFITLVIDIVVEEKPSPKPASPARHTKPVNGVRKNN